jgi:hypothetical protein
VRAKDWREHIQRWMQERGLRSGERWLYYILAEHWNPAYGYAFPGVERLRDRTGMDVRTVQRSLKRLEDLRRWKGHPPLRVEEGGGARGPTGITNRYFLAFFEEATPAFCRGSGNAEVTPNGPTPATCPQNPGSLSKNPGIMTQHPGSAPGDPLRIREDPLTKRSVTVAEPVETGSRRHPEGTARKGPHPAAGFVPIHVRPVPEPATEEEKERTKARIREQHEELRRRKKAGSR